MKTSPELLQDIFGVLSQINAKMGAPGTPSEKKSKETKTAEGLGLNIAEIVNDKQKIENVKSTAGALKQLSSGVTQLAGGVLKFGLVPRAFKLSLIKFLSEILLVSKVFGVRASFAAKEVAKAMYIISEALPDLAKGVLKFGVMQRLGFVAATRTGIISLMTALAVVGNPATLPFVLAGAAALAGLGVALTGISNVLKSISLVMLSFAGSIVLMVGALGLASKIFGVGPLASMGIIIGSIAIIAGGFTLIGILSPLIARGGRAIADLGIGMTLAGLGILAFIGSIHLANMITGSMYQTDEALKIALRTIAYMGLVFAGLGILGGLIRRGGIAVQQMGLGMIAVAGGILAIGGVYGLLANIFHINIGEMIVTMAKGIAFLGLTFAGLGLLSILIIPGTLALIGIGISLGIFSLIALGITAVIAKLGGREGLITVEENIKLMVGGILSGVIGGVSEALLGDAEGKGFFGKIGTIGKNAAILVGSIFLLIGVSFALKRFARALDAFQKPGVMKDDKGKEINVMKSSTNIARSIGTFFTTLVKTLEDPKIIPSAEKMAYLSQLLLGVKGPKLLGIRIFSAEVPGIMDALGKFAEVLTMFSKVNQIPIYEVDNKGRTKIKGYTRPKDIVRSIVSTLKSFFTGFSENQDMLEDLSTKTTRKFAEILLGKSAFRLMGLKVGRDKFGLLEPILKFSEVLQQYANFGSTGEMPTKFDSDGNVIGWTSIEKIAKSMVSGISMFIDEFQSSLTEDKISSISDKSKILDKSLKDFVKVISNFDKLSKTIVHIDNLGSAIGTLASNVGLLVTNMDSLNIEKLIKVAAVSAKHEELTAELPERSTSTTTAAAGVPMKSAVLSDEQIDKLAEAIGRSVASQMKNSTYDFTFWDGATGGKLELRRQ